MQIPLNAAVVSARRATSKIAAKLAESGHVTSHVASAIQKMLATARP
jgi:hypothetical protein